MFSAYFYSTSIGRLAICERNLHVSHVLFEGSALPKGHVIEETPLLKEAYGQISAYLDGRLKIFSLPLLAQGTDFMMKVWEALMSVPYGQTASYQDIAVKIGSPQACRAVGMANNKNPIPIIIPCHRIIGKNGKMVGYGGGIEIKKKLLEIEQNNSDILTRLI